MSDDKLTGVFVRLPLDEAQIMKLYNPKKSGNENLLAIGTPVTGGELDVVAYADPSDLPLNNGSECNWYTEVTGKTEDECTESLVRQSDALAKIAEKDAEIARNNKEISRLRSALSEIHKMKVAVGFKDNNTSLDMRYLALETLKGPEA